MNIDSMNTKKIYTSCNDISLQNSHGKNNNGRYNSFDKELETNQKEISVDAQEEADELKETNILNLNNAAQLKLSAEMKLANEINILNKMDVNTEKNFEIKFPNKISAQNTFKLDLKSLKKADLEFLEKLTHQNEINIQPPQFDNPQNLLASSEKIAMSGSVDFSKTFTDMVNQAFMTQKPVRIDFGNEIAVIIKIDKQGKVSAEFLPGDKAAEVAIKNALPELQAKLNDENLPYKELKTRNYNDKQERQKQKKEAEKDE